MNPLSLIQGIKSAPNPQQFLMNTLQQQNPAAFQQLQGLMQSGQDPQQIANQLMSQLNPQQKAQVEQVAAQFGFKRQ